MDTSIDAALASALSDREKLLVLEVLKHTPVDGLAYEHLQDQHGLDRMTVDNLRDVIIGRLELIL